MTKADLLKSVSSKVEGVSEKTVGNVIDALFESLSAALCKEGRIGYPGFGTFAVKECAARSGRNPRTGEPLEIPAHKSISFKVAPKLKDAVNVDEKKVEVKAEAKKACKKADAKADTKKACKKSKK